MNITELPFLNNLTHYPTIFQTIPPTLKNSIYQSSKHYYQETSHPQQPVLSMNDFPLCDGTEDYQLHYGVHALFNISPSGKKKVRLQLDKIDGLESFTKKLLSVTKLNNQNKLFYYLLPDAHAAFFSTRGYSKEPMEY